MLLPCEGKEEPGQNFSLKSAGTNSGGVEHGNGEWYSLPIQLEDMGERRELP